MMILFHDKYPRVHDAFLEKLAKVNGKHIIVHVNDLEEAKEQLDLYDFDFVSVDDLAGGAEILEYIKTWRQVDWPRVINIHSINYQAGRLMSTLIPMGHPCWLIGVHTPSLSDRLRELEAEIAKENPEEEGEE